MAYMDYAHCSVCDTKVFYDAEVNYEHNTGDIGVLCKDCCKTHAVVILKKPISKKVKPVEDVAKWAYPLEENKSE